MTAAELPYQQDESGQWWYVCRNYRSRAYPFACAFCGTTFYARPADGVRHCSKSCALRAGGHPSWKGGRTVGKHGYILVRPGDDPIAQEMTHLRGYVPEHRLVVARALGRPLRRDEQVHHINGNVQDNRLDNLELRVRPHGSGIAMRCRACGSVDVEPVPLGQTARATIRQPWRRSSAG